MFEVVLSTGGRSFAPKVHSICVLHRVWSGSSFEGGNGTERGNRSRARLHQIEGRFEELGAAQIKGFLSFPQVSALI
jgi:hypothetical protein